MLCPDVELEIDTATLRGVDAVIDHAQQVTRVFPGMRSQTVRVVAGATDTVVVEARPVNASSDADGPGAWSLQGRSCTIFQFRGGRIARLRTYYEPSSDDRTANARIPGRLEAAQMADQQEALRRVAALVARGVPHTELFAAVAREVGEVLGVDATHLGRFDADQAVVIVAQWGAHADFPIGTRLPLDGDSASARVLKTGQPARMDSYEDAEGTVGATMRGFAIRSTVGVPIAVDGRLWGVMGVATRGEEPLLPDTESRLQLFTGLLATAISNATAQARLRRLAAEQAAPRLPTRPNSSSR